MISSIEQAYNPDQFRKQAHAVSDILGAYLEKSLGDPDDPVFHSFEPDPLFEQWEQHYSDKDETLQAWVHKVIDSSIHLHNPHYMGHQVSPVLPMAALADFVGSMLNSGLGVYEMGSPTVAMERVVIKKMAAQFGFDDQADGILTSGGTLGNLTALLTARQIKAAYNVWEEGNVASQPPLGIMVSEEAHYSVSRAAKILGWGEEGLVKVPVDGRKRMDVSRLKECYEDARSRGIHVIALVGNAGSTATGSFDPLDALAEFAREKGLWFHVDAAHGGATIFSRRHRSLLKGIEAADSIIIDFHKMMFCPALVTALVYKNGRDAYQTFAQKAYYLWEKEEQEEWYNLGKRTFECTKTMITLKAYLVLKFYGPSFFEDVIDTLFEKAKEFASLISKRPSFELLLPPAANIVCFRHIPEEDKNLNTHNSRLREELISGGQYYIVQTQFGGRTYLRCTIMNPFTCKEHFGGILDALGELASGFAC